MRPWPSPWPSLALAMLALLWPRVSPSLRLPIVVYIAANAAMAVSALTMGNFMIVAGAVLFVASRRPAGLRTLPDCRHFAAPRLDAPCRLGALLCRAASDHPGISRRVGRCPACHAMSCAEADIRNCPCACGFRRTPRRPRHSPCPNSCGSPDHASAGTGWSPVPRRSSSAASACRPRAALRSSAARSFSAELVGSTDSAKRAFDSVYSWPQ